MQTFKVYTARLNFGNVNKFVAEVTARDLDELKLKLRTEFNLNPFYAVILDEHGNVLKNEHMPFIKSH